MARLPRYCKDCDKIYWTPDDKDLHQCVIAEPITLSHYTPRSEPKPKKIPKATREYICDCCKQPFKSKSKQRRYCSSECKRQHVIDIANDRWINPITKKRPTWSFSQLNAMAEWKRVWDDESWAKRFKASRM